MTKREWLLFFAGAEALHTISHLMLHFSNSLPINFYSLVITHQINLWAILCNATATILLLWWAQKA